MRTIENKHPYDEHVNLSSGLFNAMDVELKLPEIQFKKEAEKNEQERKQNRIKGQAAEIDK